MGLARYGIVNGIRVPLEQFAQLGHPVCIETPSKDLNPFERMALTRSGFLGIAEKLLDRTPLNLNDIIKLLTGAGLPVLMKLVTLLEVRVSEPSLTPAIMLPVQKWKDSGLHREEILNLSREELLAVPHNTVEVAFDHVDIPELLATSGSLYKEIAECRLGVRLVGPDIKMLTVPGGVFKNEHFLRSIFAALQLGKFYRLRITNHLDHLHLAKEYNLSNYVVTPIDRLDDVYHLAQDLYRLQGLSVFPELIDCWGPGFSMVQQGSIDQHTADNFQLLRVLAIGSLVLSSVPIIRASAKFFALETMPRVHQFGANDLGFASYNSSTKEALMLPCYKELSLICSIH